MAKKKASKSAIKAKPKAKTKTAKRPAVALKKKAPLKAAKPKDGGQAGWPALSPYMTVRDAGASLEFYAKAFGFKVEGMVMKDAQGVVQHAGMSLGEAKIMFAPQRMSSDMRTPAASGATDSLSLYVYVKSVDALAKRAQSAGAQLLQAPADQFWGDRIAIFRDPDGYHWTFATNVGGFDASKAPQ